MNWLDIGLLILLALSLVSGLMKGLVKEVFSLGGVVLSILAAMVVAPGLAGTVEKWVPNETAAYAVALLVVFLVVMVLVEFLARALTKVIKFVQLGAINHVLGAAFGLTRGVLIGTIVVLGIALFLDTANPVLVQSKVVPYLSWGSRAFASLLPEDIRDSLEIRLDDLDKAREEASAQG